MSKRRLSWSEEKIKRYIKEGRGNGTGRDYKPWIKVQDFPSLGLCSRVAGWKTNRVHEFMSNNETRFFYLLEWADNITDIREQFPLIHFNETVAIAEEMGVKHPTDIESGVPYIMTTDFMITMNICGKEKQIVRTLKMAADLDKKRVIEKLEIERRYWEKHNIDWGIVTEKQVPKELASNIEWIHSSYNLEATNELSIDELKYISNIFKSRLVGNNLAVRVFTDIFDKEMKMELGTSLNILKHLIAKKEVYVDIKNRIDLSMPVDLMIKDRNYSEVNIL
ncbi:TnsA endonuclease C-terminal domain-containing protein [Clostridium tagluense]|uniref:TnsA endonuclease C-terminal domain-containing protein n=1 Tax=Clostridium tagluense TaxID=360422 RepID=UPI001C0B379B|nr:TnsA endonuclease C-terminal domain-containing protein [Clostridium tagluense]MBU3128496.1 TnsA endonuclease N-terminal domain-containing protein [Clostridium tagluense]